MMRDSYDDDEGLHLRHDEKRSLLMDYPEPNDSSINGGGVIQEKKASHKGSTFGFAALIFLVLVLLVSSLSMGIISLMKLYKPTVDITCYHHPLTCNDQIGAADIFSFSKYLVVVAHPDDAVTCAGGTIGRLTQAGKEVRYVILTNGDKGSQNRSMTSPELAKIREAEERASAKVLGVASVDFVGVEDGKLFVTNEMHRNVTYFIRKYQPDALITFNPAREPSLYKHYLEHSDHRAAGQITLDCAYPIARDFLFYPEFLDEGIEPWNVKYAFLFSWDWNVQSQNSNIVVDITSTMQLKIDSMMEHKSQVGNNTQGEIKYLEDMATALGNPQNIKYAEWFTRVIFPA